MQKIHQVLYYTFIHFIILNIEHKLKSLKNCVKQKIEFNIRIEIYVTIIVNALENGNRISKA